MSCTTMPTDGIFTVNCAHCGHDTKKNPLELTVTFDLKLYSCPMCHELTLIQSTETLATVFKVES